MDQKSRRVRERTRGKEQSYLKGVFVEATTTGRHDQHSDSAAESDNHDNAIVDDCVDSLTVFSGFINRIADKLQQRAVKSQGVYFFGHGVQLHSVCVQ